MAAPTIARPGPRRQAHRRRHAGPLVLLTIAILFLSLAQTPAAAPSSTTARPDGGHDRSPDAAALLAPRDQQTPGSACAGSEGQWNCMTGSWQRCAAGRWSAVMQCAAGTACVPAGLTYDFKVQFAGQGVGGATSSAGGRSPAPGSEGRRQLDWLWLLVAAVVAVVV